MAYINKGISLKNLKRFDEAIESFDLAINLNPKEGKTYNNKGVALEHL